MVFSEKLKEYISVLGCSAKELSATSGLSDACISRYRTGERVPLPESSQLDKLASGISAIAGARKISGMTKETVKKELEASLSSEAVDFDRLKENLNRLISVLGINLNNLARSMNFDTSFLSRVRSGQRRPADPQGFVNGIAKYVAKNYTKSEYRDTIAQLIGCDNSTLDEDYACCEAIREWMIEGSSPKFDSVQKFLNKLDEFDLNEFIRAIRFDTMKVPTVPFQLPSSKKYYKISGFRDAEIDFFKATVLSKADGDVFMYSNMKMDDMAKDMDFSKKWMTGIALTLKKGLHINIIHSLDRPFEELMLGLESWIPMYMTGQISPYYLKGTQNSVFCHLEYSSGAASLQGESISGSHADGRYILSKTKEDIEYFHQRHASILKKATPLMEIFREDSANAYKAFCSADIKIPGNRRNVLAALPVYTVTDRCLADILERNNVAEKDRKRIAGYVNSERERMAVMLASGKMCDEIPLLSEEEFSRYPMVLSLSGAFMEFDLLYSYENYLDHLSDTKKASETYENYHIQLTSSSPFRNIQIQIHEGEFVMISKNKHPAIHFVIRHPKLCSAIENLMIPVTELTL